jgi:hypothetical protein
VDYQTDITHVRVLVCRRFAVSTGSVIGSGGGNHGAVLTTLRLVRSREGGQQFDYKVLLGPAHLVSRPPHPKQDGGFIGVIL